LVRSDSLLHGNLPRQQSVGLLIALEYLSSFVWKTPNLEVFHILWFLKCTMHIIKQEAMNIYTETKTWTQNNVYATRHNMAEISPSWH
jgi:hypothetical protein